MAVNGPPADKVVKKKLTEKNLVETHEGGLGQDDSENKQKVEEACGAGAKILDWSNQDEPSFEELDVAEMEELAENDQGTAGYVWSELVRFLSLWFHVRNAPKKKI